MKLECQCFIMVLKYEKEINVEAMGKRVSNFFVSDYRTHYSNCHLVILHNKTDSVRIFWNSV